MARPQTILVVDDSKLVTSVMTQTLKPHCDRIITASRVADAVPLMAGLTHLDLVLTDLFMEDGLGFDLFGAVAHQADRPPIIVCSSRATRENEQKAIDLGAIAFMAKPLSTVAVLAEWQKRTQRTAIVDRAARVRVFARVYVSGEGHDNEPPLSFEVHDVSRTGAFLVTHGPLQIGTRLLLTIVAGLEKAKVWAHVVRVQEPSWLHAGGVGVVFETMDEATVAALERMTSA